MIIGKVDLSTRPAGATVLGYTSFVLGVVIKGVEGIRERGIPTEVVVNDVPVAVFGPWTEEFAAWVAPREKPELRLVKEESE